MTNENIENSLREQIFRSMKSKETSELIEIWQENDRQAWTQDAFDAVEAELLERLGELPDRLSPATETNEGNPREEVNEEEQKLSTCL